ncbi:MAG TPA: chaperonin GroEL [Ktedonosporobacter sp.]|jgi:chaperonin GroEL|nr:chaperonin GroEL [Ktedonosporobacter sp.]
MSKQLQFKGMARYSIRKGVDTLTDAVRVTIGPRGRNVVLDHPLETPRILNDGVAIARGIDLEEPFTNMVVQLLKEAAIKTNDLVGDGTTTATIIVQAILAEGLKNVVAGTNPMLLCKGLERGAQALQAEIKAISQPVETHEEIAQVATIAAGDPSIGELIAGVLEEVGRDGLVTIEEGNGQLTEIAYIKGMQLDRGYISPYMVNNQERMETVFSHPYILITDQKIRAIETLLPLLEQLLAQGQKELLVIAADIEGEALTSLVVNKARGAFHVLGIRAPSFGDRRDEALEDIAIMTGAQIISEKLGRRLEHATLADLGRARKVITTKTTTLLVDGQGDREAIEHRLHELRAQAFLAEQLSGARRDSGVVARNSQAKHVTGEYDRKNLQQRLAGLSGGAAVIKVGAATAVEMKESTLRMQDALAATKAAIEEGIVPGGGTALVMAQSALESVKTSLPEEATGVNILRRALEEPLRQIAANAGYESSVVVANVRDQPFGHGFDAITGHYVDMYKAGIIDPTRVTRVALQNAISIASMLLTTDTLITDTPIHIPAFKDIEFGL